MEWKRLSDRQSEIMRRYRRGESATAIAFAVGLSPIMLAAQYRSIRRQYGGASIERICRAAEASDPGRPRMMFDA